MTDINTITAATGIGETGAATGSASATDYLVLIEMMMVKEQDTQLKELAKQIKGFSNVKKGYREQLEALQKLMILPSVNDKGKVKSDGKYINLPTESYNLINQRSDTGSKQALIREVYYNPTTGKTESRPMTGLEKIKEINPNRKNKDGCLIEKAALENMIQLLNEKKDAVTEQSDLTNTALQSAVNTRKNCVETISTLVNKQHDVMSTIIRNIK